MENLKPPGQMIFTGNIAQNWKRWKQSFQIYWKATGMDNKEADTQVAILLHVIGEEALEKYNTFDLADEDKEDIERIMQAFDEYCIPRTNESIERHVFFSRSQIPGESFDLFLTDLKKLSLNCSFEQLKDSLIRDRIIGGILNKNLRDRLLREDNLTLEKCIRICKTSELAELQSKMLEGESSIHEIKDTKDRWQKINKNKVYRPIINKSKQKYDKTEVYKDKFKQTEKKPFKFDCTRCGRMHSINACPAYGKECKVCKRNNHFARMCKTKYVQGVNKHEKEELYNSDAEYTEGETFYINTIVNEDREDEWFENLKLENNQILRVKLDTGAQCNVITWDKFKQQRINAKLLKTNNKLSNYDGKRINCIGKCYINCETTKGNKQVVEFQVVKTKMNLPSLLGLKTLKNLELVQRVDNVCKTYNKEDNKQLVNNYQELFEGIGRIKNCEYKIKLKRNATGKIESCRKVPLRLIQPLQKELDFMLKEGIIRKVDEPTEWVNSLVIVKNKNKLRICLDPRHLNNNILREHYQLPTFEEITSRLNDAKIFSVLDAHKAFWQIKLAPESEEYTTFNTPMGRYCYQRLPYGLSSAPEVFHKTYKKLFGDIEGLEIYIDDLLVWGNTVEEHDARLKQVFERARQNNIKFNKSKCKIGVGQVKYLGHIITDEGLKPDPDRIKAISEIKNPENKKELERCLGMITYVAKFVPNLSQRTVKLRELLKKNVAWMWNQEHEKSFTQIKEILTKEPVLQMFKHDVPITLSVDASREGLGAVVLQNRLPVAYASKSLTEVQKQYAQIEKETLAILFGCERFHQYLYGKQFTVESDHKPLEAIFKKALNKCPTRLQRMIIRMQPYDFIVNYKPGKEMYIADALSRTEGTDKVTKIDEEIETHIALITDNIPMSKFKVKVFQEETAKDDELQILREFIKGQMELTPDVKEKIGTYIKFQEEIYEANELMFKNECVIVPKSLRPEMLKKIHYNHLGVEKCKNRAREVLFWPHMAKEIEDMVLNCEVCHRFQKRNCKEDLIPREVPKGPWEVLGSDLFYYEGKDFLLIVDYYSKFVEVDQLQDLSAETTINMLKKLFARHGIPEKVYTDNGPQFNSRQFKQFEREWGFHHVTSSPRYAQSNGMSERYVQTVKKMWKKAKLDGKDPYLTLLEYRNTPISSEIGSPTSLLFGKQTKGLLPTKDYMMPREDGTSTRALLIDRQNKQKKYFDRNSKKLKQLNPNDNVYLNDTRNGNKPLMLAKVLKPANRPRSYRILTEHGKVLERNRKDLLRGSPNKTFKIIEGKDLYFSQNGTENKPPIVERKQEIVTGHQVSMEQTGIEGSRKLTRSGREVKIPRYMKDYITY